MAEQPSQTARMAAPFPAPPPFYKHFTKQSAAQLRQIRRQSATLQPSASSEANVDSKPDLDLLSLPPELRCLIPPAPPTDDKFKVFGIEHDLNAPDRTLKDLDVPQLYPDHPSVRLTPQAHLISLARSQLTTFLALVGAMSQDAEQYPRFTRDLEEITYNMHDLINQYRPHQARETLILVMEERVAKMRAETGAIEEAKGRVGRLAQGLVADTAESVRLAGEGDGQKADVRSGKGEDAWRAKQREVWAALDDETREEG